jgi:hypothetical protein
MTSDEILSNIKLRGAFPDDSYFTSAQMLTILNDEMDLTITPLMQSLHEDYYLQNKDYTITASGSYRLPSRCIGSNIRAVKLYDSASDSYTKLERLYEEDRSSGRSGYYLFRNSITLSSDYSSGTLRVTFFQAPNRLVLTASVATITSIDSATQVTVSALPSTIATNTVIDFVQADNPHDLLNYDVTVSSASGTTLTFASLPTGLAVGDYICVANESPVPVAPDIVHPVLSQAVLCILLSSKKDKALEAESVKLDRMKQTMTNLLAPRIESTDSHIRGQGLLSRMRWR